MDKKYIPFLTVFLLLLSVACGLGTRQLDPMLQTLTPLSAAVAGTATAHGLNSGGASDQLATAIANATAESQDIYATETARASLNDAIFPNAIACTSKLPMAVASIGPVITVRFIASAANWESNLLRVPPPTM